MSSTERNKKTSPAVTSECGDQADLFSEENEVKQQIPYWQSLKSGLEFSGLRFSQTVQKHSQEGNHPL